MKKELKTSSRKAVHANLKDFCYFASESDFIEVTQWTNGEGFDLSIETTRKPPVFKQFSWGEWDALKAVVNKLAKLN